MIVQVNTDANITASEGLVRMAAKRVTDALGHFSEHLTRVEVHLSDENSSQKAGADDKRCLLEARPASHQPIAVSHHAPTIEFAIDGAAEKLNHALASVLGRREGR